MSRSYSVFLKSLLLIAVTTGPILFANQTEPGSFEGLVLLPNGDPVHEASILIVQTGQEFKTDDEGAFRLSLPAGLYDVVAQSSSFSSQAQLIEIHSGETTSVNFVLQLSPIREAVTVTATGKHETTFAAVQSVNTMDSFDLSENMAPTIAETLQAEAGMAKRSFGPGSARPVVRGFDGDRVLVLRDGVNVGSIGAQSGDHAEPINPVSIERVEVVKGPATLLYGSNAVGGVVNAISRHHEMHKHRHEGTRGKLNGVLGSNNEHVGGGAGLEHGFGNWMIWGGGGGQRTGEYSTPIGTVRNSQTRVSDLNAGFGWFKDIGYLSLGYVLNDGRYGVPFAAEIHGHEEEPESPMDADLEDVELSFRQHSIRFDGGVEGLGALADTARFTLNYTEWRHDELEILSSGEEEVGTRFNNEQLTVQGILDQNPLGSLTGSFGFSFSDRDYSAEGEEALSPPVNSQSFALFALEDVNFENVRLQFGARFEHSAYDPLEAVERGEHDHGDDHSDGGEVVLLPARRFNGISAGLGTRIGLWKDGAFVANFTTSHRSPALEELYNYGPHIGNLAFEIGNPDLKSERSNGIDLSLRHQNDLTRAEANFFYYSINDFVFLAPTGEVVDGLTEAEYLQEDSRFVGTELHLDRALADFLWLKLGLDLVDAKLKETKTPLPRIPPLRGRVGLDLRVNGFSFRPEIVMAQDQSDVFENETRTPGYVVGSLKASYTFAQQHSAHHLSLNVFNIGNVLYRNHLSFIKELAPEMGRGVSFSYAMQFF